MKKGIFVTASIYEPAQGGPFYMQGVYCQDNGDGTRMVQGIGGDAVRCLVITTIPDSNILESRTADFINGLRLQHKDEADWDHEVIA